MLLKHEGYVHTTSWPHVVTLNVLNDPENHAPSATEPQTLNFDVSPGSEKNSPHGRPG